MALRERLTELIKILDLNSSVFAKTIRYDKMNLSNVLSGSTKSPKVELIVNIAEEFPNLNLRWLLTGKGEMWIGEPSKRIKSETKNDEIELLKEEMSVLRKKYELLDKKYGQIKPAIKDLNESIMEMGQKYDEMDLEGTITKVIGEIYGEKND